MRAFEAKVASCVWPEDTNTLHTAAGAEAMTQVRQQPSAMKPWNIDPEVVKGSVAGAEKVCIERIINQVALTNPAAAGMLRTKALMLAYNVASAGDTAGKTDSNHGR